MKKVNDKTNQLIMIWTITEETKNRWDDFIGIWGLEIRLHAFKYTFYSDM